MSRQGRWLIDDKYMAGGHRLWTTNRQVGWLIDDSWIVGRNRFAFVIFCQLYRNREIDRRLTSAGRDGTSATNGLSRQMDWPQRGGRERISFTETLIYSWVNRADVEDGSTMVLLSDIHSSRETGIMRRVGQSLMTSEACAAIDVSR